MRLYDRDCMHEGVGGPVHRTWLSRRNLPVVLVVAAVIAFVAFQMFSRYMYPDNYNAVQRILAMHQVGWAGIGFDGVLPQELAVLAVPCAAKITEVAPGGPADKAGLMPGDYIVGLNGETFSDDLELQGNARYFRPGDTITLDVARAGERLSIAVTLTSWSEIKKLEISGVGL